MQILYKSFLAQFNITKKLLTLVFNHLAYVYVCQCMWYHFSGGSESKESACSAGDPGLIPGFERSPGEGNGNRSSIPAWRIPWIEEPSRLESWDRRVGYDWASTTHIHVTSHILLFFSKPHTFCYPVYSVPSMSVLDLFIFLINEWFSDWMYEFTFSPYQLNVQTFNSLGLLPSVFPPQSYGASNFIFLKYHFPI